MSNEKKYDVEDPPRAPSFKVENDNNPVQEDAVFGEISEGGPNYRDVGLFGTVVLMMKTQVGLGVLSIPAAFDALGLIPGIICFCVIAVSTTWSGYIVGVFKVNHPQVYGIDDVGGLIFGRVGREILAIGVVLYWIFITGSGMLSLSISLNAVSVHGACTAIFVAVAAALGFGFGSIQTLGRVTWLAWIGLAGILFAIFSLTVAVGVQDRPAAAPQTGPWESDWKLFTTPTFAEASAALASLVFAFAGVPSYFPIVSEMRDPRRFTRALLICQSAVCVTYLVIGIVVYYFCGSFVASPALGSAGVTMKKVCYGLAMPGLLVTTALYTHFAAKYIFVRVLRGSRHLTQNTVIHWASWLGLTGGVALIAYIIASAVPVFDGLISLIGALFGTLMSFQPMGCMWLYDNWHKGKVNRTPKWTFMVGWSIFVIVAGTFFMVAGTYGAIDGIIADYKASGGSAAWSCADNSNST